LVYLKNAKGSLPFAAPSELNHYLQSVPALTGQGTFYRAFGSKKSPKLSKKCLEKALAKFRMDAFWRSYKSLQFDIPPYSSLKGSIIRINQVFTMISSL
jgi:hypothetical protein